ncbi:hypothetical protein J2S05_003105 [Alkalicoccobacillus murimartini]|uniref:Uncharacterized protein n=1 Tax=Alkalicoccobacillus murimartini TaxID=171685 RepID=A0ABT9YK98_9BACI|nr:hypothetical protein [Alkalicoccobacillus murimartini]
MYFLFLVFIFYTISCHFAFGFIFFCVGNLKTVEKFIDIFRFPKPATLEEKILHPIYLCFFCIPHVSYRYLEQRYSFIKLKLIYGSVLFISIIGFYGGVVPFMEYIGVFSPLED